MTPVQIDVLLYYHCHFDHHPKVIERAESYVRALNGWKDQGVLKETSTKTGGSISDARTQGYTTTEKGRALIEMLCATPMPVMVYADPRG